MTAYIIKRLLILIPTLLVLSFVIFFLIRLMPGDIIDTIGATDTKTVLDREALERDFGLDVPPIVQYGRWMGIAPHADGSFRGIFQGQFGNSWRQKGTTAIHLLANAWPVTLELGILAIIFSLLIALPIGILSALRQDTWQDYVGRTIAILSISVPSFWIATMIIVYPSIWWGYVPPLQVIRFRNDPIGNLEMFIIPSFLLGMTMSGATMRMVRTMMLEVLRQDYIRTAWAKGLKERAVTLKHALKNALIPVVTIVGVQVPTLVGGAVIIEQIFVLPGMGRLIISAVTERDEPVVGAAVLFFSVVLVVINLLVDLTYAFLNPRIQYK
ncbi:MAG: ABC transporter permease [Syntrophaceae bacterium]|nr:ABC transporter permease [Syntrophaceae bacterium]